MANDVIKLNTIVSDIGFNISALAKLGQDGFKAPLIITPDDFVEMIGQPIGSWQPQSNDLLWFYAMKITVYARQMLEESARIFRQMDDDKSAERVDTIIDTIEEQFDPCETAFQVYSKLLHLNRQG